ncbi:MAG: hypothetical protein U5L96_11325 [Owenweeksia sp.]|nr:hypothetical protein [Owenweeksia sp.]
MDTVLTLVSGFLNTDTRDNFMETFNSVRRSFKKLENTVGTIDNTVSETQGDVVSSVHNITEVTKTLSDNTAKLNNIFANLNTISDSLAEVRFAKTFKSLQQAMEAAEGISNKINEGEGSLGKLVNDDDLYNNLQDASKQLDLLLMDLRYNPKRYVNFSLFGEDQPYNPESLPEETGNQESGGRLIALS